MMAASQILRTHGVHERSGNIRLNNMLLFQTAKDQVDRQSLISAFSSLVIGNKRSAWIELLLIPNANVGCEDQQTAARANRCGMAAKTMDGVLGHRSRDGDQALVRRAVTDPTPFELPQLSRDDDGCLGGGQLPCEAKGNQQKAPGESGDHTIENPLDERPPLDGGDIDAGCRCLDHDDTLLRPGSGSLSDDLIPSHVEFMSDPAHEYWRWSQEEGNWWHIEEETGATIWAPLDFD